MHVHIVVNTVHPETGMTAPLKFTKLELSKWAEAYEREHGIHCEERIRNNEERRRHSALSARSMKRLPPIGRRRPPGLAQATPLRARQAQGDEPDANGSIARRSPIA